MEEVKPNELAEETLSAVPKEGELADLFEKLGSWISSDDQRTFLPELNEQVN